MTKTQAAEAIVRAYPGYPSRTLARFAVEATPGLFRDVEDARKIIRTLRGALGKAARGARKDLRREHGSPSDGIYPMPDPISDKTTEWKVRKFEFDECLLFSDVHVPFHDPALEVALAYGRTRKPDLIVLNGDIVDFYNASFFDKDPRRRFRLATEVEYLKALLEHLRDRFPKARIVYKEGNHEERFARMVWKDAPELASVLTPDGTPCTDLRLILGLDNFRIEHIGNKQPILLGEHLYVLHGHEFRAPMTNPVNPARGLFLRTKTNAICGDMHQTSHHSEAGMEHVISCWSVGCLCNLRPSYMPLNKWNHGFAMIQSHRGNWSVENHKIINGKVV
jgi:predicted phosphodiesterase